MEQATQKIRKGKTTSVTTTLIMEEVDLPTLVKVPKVGAGDRDGNNKPIARAPQKARFWSWTWNNYTLEDKKIMEQFCKESCKKYAFQEEVGKLKGTPHLQGHWEFANPRSKEALIKLFPKVNIEKVRNVTAHEKYCVKEDTRAGETFTNIEQVWDPLDKLEKTKWQIDLIELFKTQPDQRKVYWFWENKGGVGKTTFKRHVRIKNPKSCLTFSGKGADIKHSVSEFVKTNGPTALKIAIFDVTRSNGNHVDYDAIEELKGGSFFSGKYESQDIIFNWPHVVIFANFAPDTDKLSADRWEIRELVGDELKVPQPAVVPEITGAAPYFEIEQPDLIDNVAELSDDEAKKMALQNHGIENINEWMKSLGYELNGIEKVDNLMI